MKHELGHGEVDHCPLFVCLGMLVCITSTTLVGSVQH